MKKVLIPTKLDKVVSEILSAKGFTVVQDMETPFLDLAKANPDTEALIIRSEKVTPEIMDVLPSLKLVVRAGAGYDNVDIKYARRKNIDVMNTPGANSNAVAEEVIAMILAAYRKLIPADISTRAGKWEKKSFMGREFTGKTLGIIGLGHIGRLLAKRASGFDVTILGFDPVISKADVISLHVPENDATRGMVNEKLLSLVKKGVMIVNCARAGIVNEDDLRKFKAEKGIIYCNDVYKKDAEGEKSIADVADVMAPHLGASTPEAEDNCAVMVARQMIDFIENGNITNSVNMPACKMPRQGKSRITVFHKNVKNVLSAITAVIGEEGINIANLMSQAKGEYAYLILDLDENLSDAALDKIKGMDSVVKVRTIA